MAMTLTEFFAWFDGYAENIEERPSEKQWQRIVARIGEVRATPQTESASGERFGGPSVPAVPAPPDLSVINEASWRAAIEAELYGLNAAPHEIDAVMTGLRYDPDTLPAQMAQRLQRRAA